MISLLTSFIFRCMILYCFSYPRLQPYSHLASSIGNYLLFIDVVAASELEASICASLFGVPPYQLPSTSPCFKHPELVKGSHSHQWSLSGTLWCKDPTVSESLQLYCYRHIVAAFVTASKIKLITNKIKFHVFSEDRLQIYHSDRHILL